MPCDGSTNEDKVTLERNKQASSTGSHQFGPPVGQHARPGDVCGAAAALMGVGGQVGVQKVLQQRPQPVVSIECVCARVWGDCFAAQLGIMRQVGVQETLQQRPQPAMCMYDLGVNSV